MERTRQIAKLPFLIAASLAVSAAAAAAALTIRVERRQGSGWSAIVRYPVLAATTALGRRANTEFRRAVRQEAEEFAKEARKPVDRGPGWTFESDPTVSLHNARLVSGYYAVSTYTGGAHGMNYYLPVTVGRVGKQIRVLELADLFRPGRDPFKLASVCVMRRLRENDRAELVRDGSIMSLNDRQLSKWVLTPTGITFLFNPYELASYAAGPFEVKVPYEEFEGALDPAGPLGPRR